MIVSDTVRQRRARTPNRVNDSVALSERPSQTTVAVLPDLLPSAERDSIHSIRAFNIDCCPPESVEMVHIEVSSDTSGSELNEKQSSGGDIGADFSEDDDSLDECEYELEKELDAINQLHVVELRPSSMSVERQRISFDEKRKLEESKERDILKDSEENLDMVRVLEDNDVEPPLVFPDDDEDNGSDTATDSDSDMVGRTFKNRANVCPFRF